MKPTPARQSPWWLCARDQLILLVLCVLVIALAAYRLVAPRLVAGGGVELLAPGERVDYLVDVNSADEGELDLLPGIGPKRAAAIVAYRRSHGRFASLADLAKVPGINATTAAKLEGLVRFGPLSDEGKNHQ